MLCSVVVAVIRPVPAWKGCIRPSLLLFLPCLLQALLYVVVFVVAQAHPNAPGHRGGGGAELQAGGLLQDSADMEGRGLGVQRENEVTNSLLQYVRIDEAFSSDLRTRTASF